MTLEDRIASARALLAQLPTPAPIVVPVVVESTKVKPSKPGKVPAMGTLLERLEDTRLGLDPELSLAKAEWEDHEAKARWERASRSAHGGRTAGWRRGQPQCPMCRRFLSAVNGWCADCQAFGSSGHDHGR